MRKDLDDALCRDFPNLYRDRHASIRESCMPWGFECGDGWEPLTRRLAEKLELMILALPEKVRPLYRASQVKEKFGNLRFYMAAETPEMSLAIQEAEDESAVTCEHCGAPGSLRDAHGWYSTRCDECFKPA